MNDRSRISVEVAFATPGEQYLQSLEIAAGASIEDALAASDISRRFPAIDIATLAVGIWARPTDRSHILRSGDRIELYRELQIEPREARRQLALAGRTMSEGS